MTEALAPAPQTQHGLTPESSVHDYREIPYHLRKDTLKRIRAENGTLPEALWQERGSWVEERVAAILRNQRGVVSEVSINPPYTAGSDMVIATQPIGDVGPLTIRAEIKSSSLGIRDFKDKIRNKYPELFPKEEKNGQLIGNWISELRMSQWLTDNNLLLINGSEYKSEEEILRDSFYPQLDRIIEKARREKGISHQVFPGPT